MFVAQATQSIVFIMTAQPHEDGSQEYPPGDGLGGKLPAVLPSLKSQPLETWCEATVA